jgi:hypothetical protein
MVILLKVSAEKPSSTAGKDQCTINVPCRVSIIAMLPADTSNKSMPQDLLRHFDLVIDMFDTSCDDLDMTLSRAIFSGCSYGAPQQDEISLSECILVSSHMQVLACDRL